VGGRAAHPGGEDGGGRGPRRQLGPGGDRAAGARRRRPDGADGADGPRDPDHGPPDAGPPSVAQLAAQLADPGHGLTAHTRRFSRVDALAALADALPAGAASIAEIEQLCEKVLAEPAFVPLPAPGASAGSAGERRQLAAGHMRAAERYTTADVLPPSGSSWPPRPPAHRRRTWPGCRRGRAELAVEVVEAGQDYRLSAEQRAVLHDVVTSGRAVEAIVGPPRRRVWCGGAGLSRCDAVGKRKHTVAQIAAEFGGTRPTVYRHLSKPAAGEHGPGHVATSPPVTRSLVRRSRCK